MYILIRYAFALILLLAAFFFSYIKSLFKTNSLGELCFGLCVIICAILAIGLFAFTTVVLTFWVLSL